MSTTIYRYFKFEEKCFYNLGEGRFTLGNWLKDLFEGKLRMQSPSQFGDPYECCPGVDYESLKDQRALERFSIDFYPGDANVSLEDKVQHFKFHIHDETLNQDFRDNLRAAFEDFKMCSFSKKKDSFQMWSYFACDFKGMVVEFDRKKLIGTHPDLYCLEVEYYSKFPSAIEVCDAKANSNRKLFELFAKYKEEKWAHEDEIRLVAHKAHLEFNKEHYYLNFDPNAIQNVYLGYKSNQFGICLRTALNLQGSHVGIKDVGASDNEYGLIFHQ